MPGCDPGLLEEEEQLHSLEDKGVMVGHGGAPQRPAMLRPLARLDPEPLDLILKSLRKHPTLICKGILGDSPQFTG